MFGQTALGSDALSDARSRVYRFEVAGLGQNDQTDKRNYPIRRSGSVYVTVPYNRMSQEMQRIQRLGGRIVSIQPLSHSNGAAQQ